jgi:hypothetical protein
MWNVRIEIHFRIWVQCGSHSIDFIKNTIVLYFYDIPCIEFYLNWTNSVESTNKILFTPLAKEIVTKFIIIERHHGFYIKFYALRSINMESRDRTSFRPWSKAWLLLGRISWNLLENFVTNSSIEFHENLSYSLTTNTMSQTDGGRGHHIKPFSLPKERPVILQ